MQWGVIGTGWVAQTFVQALQESATEQVIAIASRELSRATALASQFSGTRAYGSYAELLADPDVEAVYIAIPDNLHAEWAIASMRAGKHVLCETPLTVQGSEAEAMFAVAREQGVTLMEASMYRFHPQTRKLQELLANGAIGTLRLIQVAFTISAIDQADRRFNSALSQGALLDIGSYAINFVRMIVGQAPDRVAAAAYWAPSGVDETLVASLEYANGLVAQISCSLNASHIHSVRLIGSSGTIELDEAFLLPLDRPTRIRIRHGAQGSKVEELSIPPANSYRLEAEAFGRFVTTKYYAHDLPEMPEVETLDNIATIEALLQAARGLPAGAQTMEARQCSVCSGAVRPVVLIEDHGPTIGEQPSAVAPGQAQRSLGIVYNEHYPTEATACTNCGHIDLWVDPEWVASLK